MNSISFFSRVILTVGVITFLGCDNKKSDPTPASAALQGQITSANSIVAVALSSVTSSVTTVLRVPSATGSYRFDSLATGNYMVSFMPASGYLAPAAQTLWVAAGATTTAAPVVPAAVSYEPGSQGGAAYSVDDEVIKASSVEARLTSGVLELHATTYDSSYSRALAGVALQLHDFAERPGTFYSDNLTTTAFISYTEWDRFIQTTWWSGPGFYSSVVVTAVKTNPRRVSGTFTAIVAPNTTPFANTRKVAGSFTDIPY